MTSTGSTAILGQRLPGDEFPGESSAGSAVRRLDSSPVTHVGPLRKESLLEIPSTSYMITQSPRDRGLQRSTGAKQLDIPQVGHRNLSLILNRLLEMKWFY